MVYSMNMVSPFGHKRADYLDDRNLLAHPRQHRCDTRALRASTTSRRRDNDARDRNILRSKILCLDIRQKYGLTIALSGLASGRYPSGYFGPSFVFSTKCPIAREHSLFLFRSSGRFFCRWGGCWLDLVSQTLSLSVRCIVILGVVALSLQWRDVAPCVRVRQTPRHPTFRVWCAGRRCSRAQTISTAGAVAVVPPVSVPRRPTDYGSPLNAIALEVEIWPHGAYALAICLPFEAF